MAAPGRVMAGGLVALLVACPEPAADPHRDGPGSSSSNSSTSDASSGAPPPATSTGTTFESLDTGPGRPGYPAPDCATLFMIGNPADVAATPRPDHDAEVLALAIDPTKAVASQARYDTVTADLAAIRDLDPTLATVHVGCVLPNGVAFWFYDDEDVNQAIYADEYHAWDCHHAYYHHRQTVRLDGIAVAIELDGVYGDAVWQSYGGLPGLGDQAPYWFQHDGWPVPASTGSRCTPVAGSITLTATLLPTGELDEREYRFERENGEVVVYHVSPSEPPQPVG